MVLGVIEIPNTTISRLAFIEALDRQYEWLFKFWNGTECPSLDLTSQGPPQGRYQHWSVILGEATGANKDPLRSQVPRGSYDRPLIETLGYCIVQHTSWAKLSRLANLANGLELAYGELRKANSELFTEESRLGMESALGCTYRTELLYLWFANKARQSKLTGSKLYEFWDESDDVIGQRVANGDISCS